MGTRCPRSWDSRTTRWRILRYGENPHQRGALYAEAAGPGPLGGAEVLVAGKEMSFNNWLDLDAAYALAGAFDRPAAVIVKHNNPCGAALAGSPGEAYALAFACDTVSAFGGIVAFNREADEDAARAMADVFTEVVVAPEFTRAPSRRSARARACGSFGPRSRSREGWMFGRCRVGPSSRTGTR